MLRIANFLICFNVLLLFIYGWAKIDFDTAWMLGSPLNWPWWAALAALAPFILMALAIAVSALTSKNRESTRAK